MYTHVPTAEMVLESHSLVPGLSYCKRQKLGGGLGMRLGKPSVHKVCAWLVLRFPALVCCF